MLIKVNKVQIEGKILNKLTKSRMIDVEVVFTPSKYQEEKFKSRTSDRGVYSMEIIADEEYNVQIIEFGEVIFEDSFEIHQTDGFETTVLKDFVIE